ncbi:hypothetical protein [Altibacter sp. HG106]|uniref:hypothetical protein n=1 Tax=Altibacter sp. HG106 TaxID=3023937 RepID=UPI002350E394|nr:hypothetical protein [Altibacter sp. HG106]MDC7993481.1 hypothetical protein [Altibacter sp. HG106]
MLTSSGPYPTTSVEDEAKDAYTSADMKSILHNLLDHKAEQSTIDLKNDWDRFTRNLHIDMTSKIF